MLVFPWMGTYFQGSRSSGNTIIARNAVNLYGPGHSAGGVAVSTGVALNKVVNFINVSGASLATASMCFAGMYKTVSTTVPYVNVGNDTPLTAKIAYPAGDQWAASGTPTTTTVQSSSTQATNYYNGGTIYWLSGVLAGTITSTGITYNVASGTFSFGTPLASAPAAADIFFAFPSTSVFTSMTQSASANIVVTNATLISTDDVTLPTPVPSLSTFSVVMVGTPANGLNYINSGLATPLHAGFGLFAVRTKALKSTLKPVMIQGTGDSIATNNSAVWTSCSQYKQVPSLQTSISGGRAKSFGQSAAANFQIEVNMAVLAGATAIYSNFGTNDIPVDLNATTTFGWLTAMRDLAAASGIPFIQATITPQSTNGSVTASLVTSVGTTKTATVPDATKFIVGRVYNMAGAVQTEYNGCAYCTARNTGLNTVDFLFVGSGTPTATGTITISGGVGTATSAHSARELMVPATNYEAGSGSIRGTLNGLIRAGGAFPAVIEFGDACEVTRNDGLWVVGGDKTELPAPFGAITVSSVVNTTRFLASNYTGPNASSGTIQCITATNTANIGVTKSVNSSNGTDITVSAVFPSTFTIGDTFYIDTGAIRAVNEADNIHPQVAVGTRGTNSGASQYIGGQALLDNVFISYLTGLGV